MSEQNNAVGGEVAHSRKCAKACDPFTGMAIRIGVMGSAAREPSPKVRKLCRELGQAIARQGCCLLTGACPGLPHQVVLGAKKEGGEVVGISPALSLKEHVETLSSPYAEYDVLIFAGLGFMGREMINIRSSDIVIVAGGRCGTLGEFAMAYEEGKLIGVLQGSGGITSVLADVEKSFGKSTGAEVIYDTNPDTLVRRLLDRYHSESYKCPCHPVTPKAKKEGICMHCASFGIDRRSAKLLKRKNLNIRAIGPTNLIE